LPMTPLRTFLIASLPLSWLILLAGSALPQVSRAMSKKSPADIAVVRSDEFGGIIIVSIVMLIPTLPIFLSDGLVGTLVFALLLSVSFVGTNAVSIVLSAEGIRRRWPSRRRWAWAEIVSIDFVQSRWLIRTDFVLRIRLTTGRVCILPVRKSKRSDATAVLVLAKEFGFPGIDQVP